PRLGHLEQRRARRQLVLLAQQAHSDSGAHEDLSVIRLILAGQDLHERGLAGSVGPYEPDSLTGAYLKGQLRKNRIAAVLAAKSRGGNENHGVTALRPRFVSS